MPCALPLPEHHQRFGGDVVCFDPYACSGFALCLSSQVVVKHSVISANQALQGAGAWIDESSNVTILHSDVISNNASYGAGLKLEDSSNVLIMSSIFHNNTATVNGGGVNVANDVAVSCA